ncbi:MAG TPA: copper chaperone PCu(A)C [Microthrixaceae bacterium]|nr:copper chaperone PCu(A)C [Microthrixaceae bacterium]
MKARSLALASVLTLAVLGASACGDDTTSDAASDETTTTLAAGPTISGAWARNSPMEATNGAAYLAITGGTSDDQLVSASVDSTIAGKVELHETVAAGDSGDGSMGATTMGAPTTAAGDTMTATTLAPAMEMRPVEAVEVPAGKKVELKPGGYHIMLLDLVQPLVVGDSFDLTLTFAEAGEQVVTVEVKDAP